MTNAPLNAFSVDVEDWFQVSDFESRIRRRDWDRYESRVLASTRRLLALLREHRTKATFFILTWNAERWPVLVEEIAADGHEIASHGHSHELVYELGRDGFRRDLDRSIEILSRITGRPVPGYRAPSFSVTAKSLWALDVMLEAGLDWDSSVFPVEDSLYGIPGAQRFPYTIHERDGRQLVEFPMTTARLLNRNLPMGGGAYLRVLPYPYLRSGMRQVNAAGHPAVVYLHPWEIDPEHPRLRIEGKRGFSSHYLRLRTMETKLGRLLSDFRFAPIGEVLGKLGLLHSSSSQHPVLPETLAAVMMRG